MVTGLADKVMKKVAVSDVDGTLVGGSLVLEHAIWLHDARKIDLGLSGDMWLHDKKNESVISLLAETYRERVVGMSQKDMQVNEFLDNYFVTGSFYSTISDLMRKRQAGWDVHLISGSPDYLVEPFAKKFGFVGHGSRYQTDSRHRLNGKVIGLFGADAKRKKLKELKIRKSATMRVVGYGDTLSDMPLFEVANKAFLVAPSPRTLEGMKRLNLSWEKIDE